LKEKGKNLKFEHIIFEKAERLATILLNRPKKLNALSVEMQKEIVRAIGDGEADPKIRVIVIKGAGRGFSAGYDIDPSSTVAYRQRSIVEDRKRLKDVANRWLTLWDCEKPIIAQVHGFCLAGGTDMALLADVVIAAEDAKIGHPGVRGIGTPLTQMWAHLVGPMRAKMLMLTGDTISGKEAAEWGLVAKAVPSEQLEAEVMALARRMAAIPVDLLSLNKLVVNRTLEVMGLRQAITATCELDSISHFTPTVENFWEIVNREGMKQALKWRDRDFEENR
jgi:enoyl-CoA hydratase